MPLSSVPIAHRFGIISQNHKRQLQQRLLEKKRLLEEEAKLKNDKKTLTFHITEEFVTKYNECDPKEKPKLDQECFKILEKIKRKLGPNNSIDDINLQIAWAELSQLVQCNSIVQEDCMDLFIASLETAKLASTHAATLFFLAETVIYWLRMETINQPFLRALEIKLLKVGQLVFQRIYYHFIEGILDDRDELKQHLAVYLEGFENSEGVYSPYPEALLCMRYIVDVGSLVLAHIRDKEKENESDKDTVDLKGVEKTENENEVVFSINKQPKEDFEPGETAFTMADLVKAHDLSPTLWHAVDLFVCLKEKNKEDFIQDATKGLIECSHNMNKEHWVDCIHALYVLGECAKLNLTCLNALLKIAEGKQIESDAKSLPSSISKTEDKTAKFTSGIHTWRWEIGCVYAEVLADICIYGSRSDIKKRALLGWNKTVDDCFKNKGKNQISFGLLDITGFITGTPKTEQDWGWKVRYMAIKGLVRLCKMFKGDSENEDLRKICWSSLVICRETELNNEVLEAIKVGQVATKGEELNPHDKNRAKVIKECVKTPKEINIHSQMGQKLGESFIMPIYAKNEMIKSSASAPKVKFTSTMMTNKTRSTKRVSFFSRKTYKGTVIEDEENEDKIQKVRPTLLEEIELKQMFEVKVPPFEMRHKFDLMRIVEDQYRKEEQKKIEEHIKALENDEE